MNAVRAGSDALALSTHDADCEYFRPGDRGSSGNLGQSGMIHEVGDVIAGVEEHAAEPAKRFLGAAFVAGDGDAFDRGQDAIEMAHDLAHGDLVRRFGEEVTTPQARKTADPATLLQTEHDLLKELLGDIVAPGQFADGDRSPTILVG